MRSIAHCDRCRRWRYCLCVNFHNERGQILRRPWLCHPCSTLIGVRPVRDLAHPWRALAEAVSDQMAAAPAHVEQSQPAAVLANPDGTITCIWIIRNTQEEDV